MEQKGSISDYRNKLDETLSSPDLTNDEILRTIVKNQISGCNEGVIDRKSKEVSNFLNMLRSASTDNLERSKLRNEPHGGWKLKQDTEDYRVMYREGAEGARFHTLLVEGYIDGPVDVCMCISCESSLYKQWWPQLTIPTFRVLSSDCLQRIRPGEQISVVRMKLPWPLSSREALIHYFAFEYFQDGLMVVLVNSISDSEIVELNTHGFTRDGIPNAEEVVRIDLVGGFVNQKVTENRSYFRTIGNMDLKLDFVPPPLINFISRQVVGSGFKLFKKEVAAVSKGDERFLEALKDPLYARIRKYLYPEIVSTEFQELEESKDVPSIALEEQNKEEFTDKKEKVNNQSNYLSSHEIEEIEQKDLKENEISEVDNVKSSQKAENNRYDDDEIVMQDEDGDDIRTSTKNIKIKKVTIRPEVKLALETLDKAITTFREFNKIPENRRSNVNNSNSLTNLENVDVRESESYEGDRTSRTKSANSFEFPRIDSPDVASCEPITSPEIQSSRQKEHYNYSYTGETNQSKIAPTSVDEYKLNSNYTSLHFLMNDGKAEDTTLVEELPESDSQHNDATNSIGVTVESRRTRNKKSLRFRCLPFGL